MENSTLNINPTSKSRPLLPSRLTQTSIFDQNKKPHFPVQFITLAWYCQLWQWIDQGKKTCSPVLLLTISSKNILAIPDVLVLCVWNSSLLAFKDFLIHKHTAWENSSTYFLELFVVENSSKHKRCITGTKKHVVLVFNSKLLVE